MSDPKVIYLQPECCADPATGRLWCEDDAPQDCEDGVPWTKYVLAEAQRGEPAPSMSMFATKADYEAALAQRGEPAGWSGDPSTQDYASTQPEAQRDELEAAVERLYFAAHWTPDRECDAVALWTTVRDAAGITPGQTKTRLGEVRSAPAQRGEPVDSGPWSADASEDGSKAWVDSHDFTHDVRLYVNGDFADNAQRFAYAEHLARKLNAALGEKK